MEIYFQDYVGEGSGTLIKQRAFANSQITTHEDYSPTELKGVHTISDYAFYNCNFTTFNIIELPSSVISIGDGAFADYSYASNLKFRVNCPTGVFKGEDCFDLTPTGTGAESEEVGDYDATGNHTFTWSSVRGVPEKSGTITITGGTICGGFVQEDWEEQGFGPASRGLQMDIVFTGDVDASGFVTGDIKYAWAISYTESSSNGDYWYALSDIKDSPYDFNEATFTLYGSTDPYSLIPDPNSPFVTAIAGTLTLDTFTENPKTHDKFVQLDVPQQYFSDYACSDFKTKQKFRGIIQAI